VCAADASGAGVALGEAIVAPLQARVVELEIACRRAIGIIDTNLYRQAEKVEDAAAVLRRALDGGRTVAD
jgi:hypothetical protein